MSSFGTEDAGRRTSDDAADEFARRRIWVVLSASAVVLVAVMLLPILASFTSVLDGVVAGVGVAYIVGFFEFLFALAGAVAYCRWINQMEARTARRRRERSSTAVMSRTAGPAR